jgi:hypothetical protein
VGKDCNSQKERERYIVGKDCNSQKERERERGRENCSIFFSSRKNDKFEKYIYIYIYIYMSDTNEKWKNITI